MDKKELDDLYSKSFAMNVQLSSEYSVVAVASVLLGQAMRLYKTVLSEEDFNKMMVTINETSHEVRPYDEFSLDTGSTMH
tara:strand:- start:462 stop:701 length:240 start_codon:yes stop_codon:yes gene_type:complete